MRYHLAVNISSFHTHTYLCRHASGTPADYVAVARDEGCSALGISDHCPYPDATWQGSRMTVAQVPLYRLQVEEARKEAPFPVFWGFECEWHPDYESWYRDFLRAETGAEYLAYGSHWVRIGREFEYIPEVADSRHLRAYVDLTLEGIGSGLFDFVAHPDIFLAGFTSWTQDIRSASRDIISAAIDGGLPLEINGLGLTKPQVDSHRGRRAPYPVREFFELAASMGATLICNSDAHRPQDVLGAARTARDTAGEWSLDTVDAVDALPFAAAVGSRG